ncbi:hypothetical protein J5N97_011221 [Dioscorea zingiberensis]|uniref:Glycosyl transferase 64 domain-containing protein n=1 Tax=Dioscorea zingiberensis TaxID=325984 RepID=A0A9D5HNI5_9LILI|nr:hypothetical protein J5N97_011221 [Dioscorea zingiberensis]
MILTGAAFIDGKLAFDRYWSEQAKEGREFVDKKFNCEDVLLNFLYVNASKPGKTVEYVRPSWAIDTSKFTGAAISKNTQVHYQIRSECMVKFAKLYGSVAVNKWSFNGRTDGANAVPSSLRLLFPTSHPSRRSTKHPSAQQQQITIASSPAHPIPSSSTALSFRLSSSYRRSSRSAIVVGLTPILEICRFLENLRNGDFLLVDCLLLLDGCEIPDGFRDSSARILRVSAQV